MIDPRCPDFTSTPAAPGRPSFQYTLAGEPGAPLVTIVTPTYNPRAIFRETAETIFAQSLQQFEWIIVDDGSTLPDARALLSECARGDSRARIVRHDHNLGPSAARNTGFVEARAAQVFLLDDDDLIEPTTFEKLYWFLQSYPEFAVASTWCVGFDISEHLWAHGFDRGDEFLQANQVPVMTLVRRAAYQAVGGFDTAIRNGLEDWDFWWRLADHGLWGGTIPEYLCWYRQRPNRDDRWQNWGDPDRLATFRSELERKYPGLAARFPKACPRPPQRFAPLREEALGINRLGKAKPRLLMIVPWMTMGGADKFNLDVVRQLVTRGWEVTLATTRPGDNAWLPEFTQLTPDAFVLDHFLKPADRALFIRYLIESRQPDVVLITNSELGYQLLPYLRANCPDPAYVDYCHMEEVESGGGYPRYAVAMQDQLDLNLVSSEHLKRHEEANGADPSRIEAVYTNCDPAFWRPDPLSRARVRTALGISETRPVLLYAGRLTEQKQPRVFARVIQALAATGLEFVALVAGDGPDRPWLDAFIRDSDLQSVVHLLGPQSPAQMHELMPAGDILFLPSKWEGIALVLFEAMACGLAVVSAAVGGQAELVTPECGVLLPPADPDTEVERYTQHLARLIASPNERQTMGARARARIVEHFGLAHMGERMVAMLRHARQLQQQAPRTPHPPRVAHEWAVQAIELLRVTTNSDQMFLAHRELGAAREELLQHVREVEGARDWFREQTEGWQKAARELGAAREELLQHVREVEGARDWFREQAERWEQTARRAARAQKQDREQFEQQLAHQRSQSAALQTRLHRIYQRCDVWKNQLIFRILRRARLLRDLTLDD